MDCLHMINQLKLSMQSRGRNRDVYSPKNHLNALESLFPLVYRRRFREIFLVVKGPEVNQENAENYVLTACVSRLYDNSGTLLKARTVA